MKRLLIVPMVLALVVFSLYYENVDGMDTEMKGNVTQEIHVEDEPIEIYNNSNDEINTTIEVNETIEQLFSVKIKGDLNTTKETVITLVADVKNAQNLEACNYFWYENKKIISLGGTLQKSFEKGEHNITLLIKNANGEETNSSVMVRAYNYKSVTTLNYDPHYGELLYKEKIVTNHKGNYVLYDDGIYSKALFNYDKDDQLMERVKEYYSYPKENTKTEYSYNDKGNRLVSQTFNSEGESIHYMLNIYDENSSLINIKFGTSAEDIDSNEESHASQIIYDLTYTEIKVPKDVQELNDNGQVIYEENYYADTKIVSKMTYDEENKLIKSERSTNSTYDSSTTIMDYDTKGNSINTEKKYEMNGHGSCHYSSAHTYTDANQIKSAVSTLLGGACHYIDEVKRVYSYDKDGNVINIKSTTDDGDVSEAYTTLEVIKEYINELDIY